MDCSIIIVSWNNRYQIQKCLESILNTDQGVQFEVFVIDNNSTDGTQEIIKAFGNRIHSIINTTNTGFAYACNQALTQAVGEYVILLNPDTIVPALTCQKVVNFFNNYPDAGIMGPRLNFPDGTLQNSVRRFPDVLSHMLMFTKLHNFFPNCKTIRQYYARDFNYSKVAIVDQVMGAFFSFRKKLVDQIGLLDDHYYIWYEEVDFCYQARRAGWYTYYYPEIVVQHEKGTSFKQRNPIRLQLILSKSQLRYFRKNHGFVYVVLLLPFAGFGLVLSMIQSLFNIRKFDRNL